MADPKKSYNDIITWAKGTSNDIIAKKLATPRSISITNNAGTSLASGNFDGSANVTLKLPATVAINISGNAATATSATSATSATTAGTCTGNAATATKLKTARNISLTGDVTGSGSFDGGGNLAIATTIAAPPVSPSSIIIHYENSYVVGRGVTPNYEYLSSDYKFGRYLILTPITAYEVGGYTRYCDAKGVRNDLTVNGYSSSTVIYQYLLTEGCNILNCSASVKYYFALPFRYQPVFISSWSRTNACGYVYSHTNSLNNSYFQISGDNWRQVDAESGHHIFSYIATGHFRSTKSPDSIRESLYQRTNGSDANYGMSDDIIRSICGYSASIQ